LSEAELSKTVLHELYRLTTSVARGTGGGLNNAETKAAFEFAERAFNGAFDLVSRASRNSCPRVEQSAYSGHRL